MTIDENTPPGLTIFRGIQALDTDKPNTPNSDVTYSIIQGNEDKKFSIEGNVKAVVVLRKPLDYEKGDSLFNLTILARVRDAVFKTSLINLTRFRIEASHLSRPPHHC